MSEAARPLSARQTGTGLFVVGYVVYLGVLVFGYLLVVAPRLRTTYAASANEGIAYAALLVGAWLPVIVLKVGDASFVALFVALQPLLFRFGYFFRAPVVPDVSPTNDPIMLGGVQLLQAVALTYAWRRWRVGSRVPLRRLWWENLPARGLWLLLAGTVTTNVIFHGPLLGLAIGVQAVIPTLATFLLVARAPTTRSDLLRLVAAGVGVCLLAFALNPTGQPEDIYYVAAVNELRPSAGSIGGHNLYGTVLVATVAMLAFATGTVRSRAVRLGLAAVAVLFLGEMLTTFSRGPILSAGALFLLLVVYSRRDVGSRWILAGTGLGVVAFLGIVIRQLTARALPLGLALFSDQVNLGRTTQSLDALRALLRLPFTVIGYGIGLTGYGDDVAVKGVHQALLSTWVYSGLIGLCGLLLFFAGVLREAWQVHRLGDASARAWARATVAFYVVWFIGLNSSGYNLVYGHPAAFAFFAVPAGALVALSAALPGRGADRPQDR